MIINHPEIGIRQVFDIRIRIRIAFKIKIEYEYEYDYLVFEDIRISINFFLATKWPQIKIKMIIKSVILFYLLKTHRYIKFLVKFRARMN